MDNIWDIGAEIYSETAPQISFYQKTSEKFFDFFDTLNATTICDLGCGSSTLMIEKILEKCPNIECIYCIDSSKKMTEVLSNKVRSSKVKIYNANAENFSHFLITKIDVFIINSAFWLFNLEKTLKQISNSLKSDGKVIFNIAEWDYHFQNYTPHPKYEFIDNELKKRNIKIKKTRGSKNKITENEIMNLLSQEGFSINTKEIINIEFTKMDWLNFYSIPSIAKRSLPDLSEDIGMEILSSAISRMSKNDFSEVKCIFFEAGKR